MKIKCKCTHEVQDKLHGKGVRIANPKANPDHVTCTVCGTQHKVK